MDGNGIYGGAADPRAARKCFSRIGLAYTLFFVIGMLSEFLAVFLLQDYADGPWGGFAMMLSMLSMYPLALPVAYLVIRTVPKRGPVGTRPVGGARFLGILIVSVGFMFLGNLIGQFLMLIVSLLTGESMVNSVQELILSMDIWQVFLAAVVAAPIVEEFLFRKLLLDRIVPYGQLLAVLLSGTLFGLAHGNFFQFFYAFALGVIFAYVYLRTGRLRYTVALHMLINFLGSIVPMAMIKYMETDELAGALMVYGNLFAEFLCMIFGVILLIVFRRQVYFKRTDWQIPANRCWAVVFGNAGMLLFLAYCIGNFLLQ